MILCGVVSIATASAHVVAELRRGGRPWLVRVVRRDGGSFLVIDQILVIALSGIGLAVVAGGGLYSSKVFYINHEAADSISWRLAMWTPSFIISWLVLLSSVGTFLHISGHRCPPFVFRPLSSKLGSFSNPFTLISIALGGAISAGLIVAMILGIVHSKGVTSAYKSLRSFLRMAIATNASVDDPMVAARLAQLSSKFYGSLKGYRTSYKALLSIFAGSSVLLIILSMGSAAFVAIVRRQVLAHKAEMRESAMPSGDQPPGTATWLRRASQAPEQISKQEQRTAALKKVELEHLIITVGALTISLLLLAQSLVTVVNLDKGTARSWSENEFSVLFIYWVYGCVVLIGSSLQLVIELRHMPPPANRRSTLSLATANGGTFNLSSIGRQVTVDIEVQVQLEVDEEEEADWRTKGRKMSYA